MQTLRSRPEWAIRLEKARQQASEMGLSLSDVAGPPSDADTPIVAPENGAELS